MKLKTTPLDEITEAYDKLTMPTIYGINRGSNEVSRLAKVTRSGEYTSGDTSCIMNVTIVDKPIFTVGYTTGTKKIVKDRILFDACKYVEGRKVLFSFVAWGTKAKELRASLSIGNTVCISAEILPYAGSAILDGVVVTRPPMGTGYDTDPNHFVPVIVQKTIFIVLEIENSVV